jgi:choline dehydrogenase-like flavoprotein
MAKNPPDLPRLLPSTSATDRVQVQESAFTYDVLGRYICNDWLEVEAQTTDGGFPFDAVVIGAGMFGGYCAEKLYRYSASANLRVLVLEAGPFLFPTHIQNLPQRLGGSVGGPRWARQREDGSGTQNGIWGMPWISNEPFPGLAYCLGGRSLFWGGWSPRLTAADLANWPANLVDFLTTAPAGQRSGYELTEDEVGVSQDAQYILHHDLHDKLLAALQQGRPAVTNLDAIEDAPLAVNAGVPASGLFPFDKFSSPDFLVDAVRADAATAPGADVDRRLFVVPRTHVVRLNRNGTTISSIDLVSDGLPRTLNIAPSCAVVLAAGTVETTRLALDSLGIGSTTYGSPRVGNLMAHLRSNITFRVKRTALGLPAGPPTELETTAFLVRGSSQGRRFHFQVSASAAGGSDPEKNMWEQVPDVELQGHLRAIQDPNWITIIFRTIGEMGGQQSLTPDPARSWIDLSSETDENGQRRAYVNLVKDQGDGLLWADMDNAAFQLAATLGHAAGDVQYWYQGAWQDTPPAVDPVKGGPWRDTLGSTHHEAGTLFAGAPGVSITDSDGRFHDISNGYVAGPAVFPSLGSANPSLTALSLARRTATAIVTAAVSAPPDSGFAPLSLDPADWTYAVQPGSQPQMRRVGGVLETASGYGLYFYTREQFANFALWLEWREQHSGDNSGVFIRTPGPGVANPLQRAVDQGHEIQIDDVGAPDGAGAHRTGAIYALQAPTAFPFKPPGEWNTYLIEANGNAITVSLNGVHVNSYASTRESSGYLALQMHDSPSRIQFRNLQVKNLP